MSEQDILFEERGPLGLVTLNRPQVLNALTYAMALALDARLQAWAADPAIQSVLIQAAGDKAFCAGGDVRALYEAGRVDGTANFAFYADEYRLNTRLKRFSKPVIAWMDGIVMGGGVGISVHARYRVGADATRFAMPETGIGLFPDVGGAFFLPRMPDATGLFLGLTGARLGVADCIDVHLIDYQIPRTRRDAVIQALATGDYGDGADALICEVLASNAVAPDAAPLRAHRQEIAACFDQPSVEAVLEALKAGSDWAQKQAAAIEAKSPTSLRMTMRQLREGASLDFEECMALEYRLARACMTGHDFYEGVRAIIIDKDNAPKWRPPSLAETPESAVDAAFAPLGEEELTF